jgi:hypothetical protein
MGLTQNYKQSSSTSYVCGELPDTGSTYGFSPEYLSERKYPLLITGGGGQLPLNIRTTMFSEYM